MTSDKFCYSKMKPLKDYLVKYLMQRFLLFSIKLLTCFLDKSRKFLTVLAFAIQVYGLISSTNNIRKIKHGQEISDRGTPMLTHFYVSVTFGAIIS